MSSRDGFLGASGLRPLSAFVVIGGVVLAVAAWVAVLAGRPAEQPRPVQRRADPAPAFAIEDAAGRPIALSVPRFDLEMSPRSMWQAHTPERMAARIADVLGGDPGPDELLARMLPDAVDGVVTVEAWDLGAQDALRVDAWIRSGGPRVRAASVGSEQALAGIWLEPAGEPGRFRIAWRPAELLAQETRRAHGCEQPASWARRLASGLAAALEPDVEERTLSIRMRDRRRAAVWAALLPSGFAQPLQGVPAERVPALTALLAEEGVSPWQMRVAGERERAYPSGQHELFGSWGWADPDQTEPAARAGLELLADRALAAAGPELRAPRPAVYSWLSDRSVRGGRANAFLSFRPSGPAPVVTSTLDLSLQSRVRAELEELERVHRPALAMAIVLDVESGDVLALDSVEAYDIQPFAPVFHAFTPGSTFKLVTMSVALEEGAVRPDSRFDVGGGEYRLVDPADGRTRTIHEAEGSRTGNVSAAECLAFSVNAGLAQIGLRVPAPVFRDYLGRLGYGALPGSGLGVERAGWLPPLPWKYRFTHASIGFGHELSTTLWGHAAALASVVRGGEYRPLSLLSDLERAGHRVAAERAAPDRLWSEGTCAEVRAMMELSAREASHRKLWLDFGDAGPVGTKTGTAQKVPSELCLHVELAERQRCGREGLAFTKARRAALRSQGKPHSSCYTSSMCAYARHAETGRRILVLVVADEPRGKQKYGADVAGPTAAAILREAVGLTRGGGVPVPEAAAGFGPTALGERNPLVEPWREGEG